MINFFRKKRKSLANENKSIKYARYAIGEIVLVVIGILIALSINNWNDVQKVRNFEQDILLLIDQNLEKDQTILSRELIRAKRANDLTDSLLEQVSEKNYADSINYWMGEIITFQRFKSQTSAFEVLKSKGIEAVTDKELQLELISYYDVNLFSVYQSLNDVEQSFKSDWVPVIKTDLLDYQWMNYCQPIDAELFFNKPSTLILFKLFKDNRRGIVVTIEIALDKIDAIRKRIKNNN